MWKLTGNREDLLQHGFIRDDEDKRYIQNPDVFEYGGECFILDDEKFFRVLQFCMETSDDAYYTPEKIADQNNAHAMQYLVAAGLAAWDTTNIRYSDIYKREIRGDSCCPFWRPESAGICKGWPGKDSIPCPADADGNGCPLFGGKK